MGEDDTKETNREKENADILVFLGYLLAFVVPIISIGIGGYLFALNEDHPHSRSESGLSIIALSIFILWLSYAVL